MFEFIEILHIFAFSIFPFSFVTCSTYAVLLYITIKHYSDRAQLTSEMDSVDVDCRFIRSELAAGVPASTLLLHAGYLRRFLAYYRRNACSYADMCANLDVAIAKAESALFLISTPPGA